jgi:hypothetical protein
LQNILPVRPWDPLVSLGAWDPRVRADRTGAWDPRVRADRTGAWDPRVRADLQVGPICKVGLKKFKCKCSHISKIDTWMTHGYYT